MVEYDPLNELTQQQLDKVADENFDDFLNYLDQKTEYLKQFSKPLGTYQTKNYASLSKGRTLTLEELQRAKEIGKVGDIEIARRIAEAAEKLGNDPKYKDEGIKNLKTNRKQWFD
tara:strand:+ start:129 stop:473 length:345 start_codon:yes stop_codon:yes gene_type:complete